ncbi:Hypothetical protein PBC10988_2390 [Planctomycetales bacterium 10988]|nr:Hypothetical protein PBC10988_2390 [Planctomycetales bacterium 10988]
MNDSEVSNSTDIDLQAPSIDEDALLKELQALWQPHHEQSLRVRYQTGQVLNERLGTPEKRQPYGQTIIQRVATELKIDKSDISRMRRFAAKYESFEDFHTSEPTVKTWTEVRTLLTNKKSSERTPGSRAIYGVLRSVQSSTNTIRNGLQSTDSNVKKLREALNELYQVAHTELDFQMENLETRVENE